MSVHRTVILGGGVGGLSAAHELRRRGYMGEIILFESLDAVGGVARSSSIPNTGRDGLENLATEYSWRGLGSDYETLHQLLREIQNENGRGTVADRLEVYDRRFLIPGPHGLFVSTESFIDYLVRAPISWYWRVRVFIKALVALTSCRERITHEYSKLSWGQFLGIDPVKNQQTHSALVRSVTPSLGPDPYRASASSIMEYVETGSIPNQKYHMMVFDAPTSEAWFNSWHRQLVDRDHIMIMLQHKIDGFVYDETKVKNNTKNTITHVRVAGPNGIMKRWKVDAVINALPPHIAAPMMPEMSKEKQSLSTLSRLGLMYMPGIQFYFNEPLVQTKGLFPAGVFLIYTPWNVTIEPQGATWRFGRTEEDKKPWPNLEVAKKYGDGTIKDIWSVTICDDDRPGVTTAARRPWRKCTASEVVAEVWNQILNESSFSDTIRGASSGKKLRNIDYQLAHVWDTFVDKNGHMQHSIEPMVSSNAGTRVLRPSTVSTSYSNMWWATAYVQNRKEMIRMDAAAEAGIVASEYARQHIPTKWLSNSAPPRRLFVSRWNKETVTGSPRLYPRLCAPCRFVDSILHKLRLPHAATMFTTLLCLSIILCLIVYNM